MAAFRFIFVGLLFTLGLPTLGAIYHEPDGKYTFEFPGRWKVTSRGGSDAMGTDGGAACVRIVHVPGGGNTAAQGQANTEEPTAAAPAASAHTDDGTAGEGHVLQGALQDATSGPTAFKAGLRRTRGVFDASIKLLSVARSKENPNLTMASFTAAQQGVSVGGLVIAVYDPAGHSRFALLYDAPDHLAKSLPAMLKRFDTATQETLEKARPQGASAAMDFARFEKEAGHVALNRVQFQDGTASIGVAPGFKPLLMSGGKFLGCWRCQAWLGEGATWKVHLAG